MAERQFMERCSLESDGLSQEKNSDKNISFSSDKNTGENGKYQQDACDKEADVKASPLELTMSNVREQAKPLTSKDRLYCDHTTYAKRAQKRKVSALNAQTSAHENKRLRTESSSSDSTSTNETTYNLILRQKYDIANDPSSSKETKLHVVMEDDEPGTLQGDTLCNVGDSTIDLSLEHSTNNPDVNSMDSTPDTSTPTGSKKTKKTVFPFCQKVVLLMAYNRNKYPSFEEYVQLSTALDVPVLPIKNWFHNRRNRERPQLQLNDARSPETPDTRTSMPPIYHTPMPLHYTQHALVHHDQNYLFPYYNIYGSYVSSYIGPGTSGLTPNLNAEPKTQDHREPEIRINCSRQQVLETSKPLVARQSVVESPTENNLGCQTLKTDHSSFPESSSTNRQTPSQIQTQKDDSANDSCSSKGKKLVREDAKSNTVLGDASSNSDDSTPDLSLEHSFTDSNGSSIDSARDASNRARRKRERTVFTPYQLDSLNALFNSNKGRIDQDTHNNLCTTLNLPRTVIGNWFINKRRAINRQVKTNRPHLMTEGRSDAMSANSISYAREHNAAYDAINSLQNHSYPEKKSWIHNYCRQQIPKMSNSPVVNRERVVEATLTIARRNLFPMGISSVNHSVVNNGFISQINPNHLMLQPLAPLDLTMPKGGDQSKTNNVK